MKQISVFIIIWFIQSIKQPLKREKKITNNIMTRMSIIQLFAETFKINYVVSQVYQNFEGTFVNVLDAYAQRYAQKVYYL